jgi:hypothetical protein
VDLVIIIEYGKAMHIVMADLSNADLAADHRIFTNEQQ